MELLMRNDTGTGTAIDRTYRRSSMLRIVHFVTI